MTGQISVRSSSFAPSRRHTVYPVTSTPTQTRTRDKSKSKSQSNVGELAGGTAANICVVCCCCPCVILECLFVAVYKLPVALVRRIWKKQKQKLLVKKNKRKVNDVVVGGIHVKHVVNNHCRVSWHSQQTGQQVVVGYADELSDFDLKEFERVKVSKFDYETTSNLDPIDGTKSFITGKPLFGTLIALLYKGQPILGIIDQPILRERWIGIVGRRTTLNGQEVSTRSCADLSQAYLYTTSPHLFAGAAEDAFIRVRNKVKVPLYGCDCYAYALLASGFVDLVIESGLKPYDFLALIPVIKGAGGSISDWKGDELFWEASPESHASGFNVVAAGNAELHHQAVLSLEWQQVSSTSP